MLHNWCFKDKNPIFSFKELKFSIQIFTDTNRYDLDESKCIINTDGDTFTVTCNGLQWAGGQENCDGQCEVKVASVEKKYLIDVKVKKDEFVKKVKVTLYDEIYGTVVARRRYDVDYDEHGKIFNYPNGWDDLFTPLITIKNKDDVKFYRSLDKIVRPKHFMVKKVDNSSIVEMIFEEDARHHFKELVVPTWEVGSVSTVDEIFEIQRVEVEKAYNLKKWEDREDVPEWTRKISLVISLHGMHWSGYIFNTYAQMLEKLRWFACHIDPKDVLVYIPGFDGRYYYKYCDFSPDERLGGEKGLKELIDEAHKMGYHIMPMFMINGANPNMEGFDVWGVSSYYYSPNGFPRGVGSCDWDTSRGYDLGCGVALNPGAPLWQDRFVDEVIKQVSKFNFDAIFLDLAAIYINDPRYSTHDGAVNIINRIHEKFPHLLISTEGWYDALSTVFPFSQVAGMESRDGEMIYHDTPYAKFFDDYNRCFGHLCLGDLAGGKNGVFEWGFNPAESVMPVRKALVPTITIVDDTISLAEDKIKDVIKLANEYKNKFIK